MYSPPADPTDQHRMRRVFARSAETLGVAIAGPEIWGWHGRTLSSRVEHPNRGVCWLRLLSTPQESSGKDLEGKPPGRRALRQTRPQAPAPRHRGVQQRRLRLPGLAARVHRRANLLPQPRPAHGFRPADHLVALPRTDLDYVSTRPHRPRGRTTGVGGPQRPALSRHACPENHGLSDGLRRPAHGQPHDHHPLSARLGGLRNRTCRLRRRHARDVLPTRPRLREPRPRHLPHARDGGRIARIIVVTELLQSASRGDHPELVPALHFRAAELV